MRKKRPEERENLDRWLLTYADMITLLMAFFIMVYSMSVMNLSKFREAAISIRSGFGGEMRGQGRSILGTSGMFAAKPSAVKGDTAGVVWRVLKPLVTYVEKDVPSRDNVRISTDTRGVVITMMSDNLLFAPGSAELRPETYPLIDRVAEALDKVMNRVQVEGHTCDLPPRKSKYPTNWELSTARATNVLRYLAESKGLDASRFAASGYGSVKPIVPNTSEEYRRKNRRVEIIILWPGAPQAGPEPDSNRWQIRSRD